jgi:hypothetical protein
MGKLKFRSLMLMDNDRDIKFDIVIGSPLEEQFCIFEMSAKTRYKKWAVKIQHCQISQFDMWVDNDVLTLKIFYRSPFSK